MSVITKRNRRFKDLNLEFLHGEHVYLVEKIEVDCHYGWVYFEFEATHGSIFGWNHARQLWTWWTDRWVLYTENYGTINPQRTGRGIAHADVSPEKYVLPSAMKG